MEAKYASESIKDAISKEIKKEYKLSGKVLGPSSRRTLMSETNSRIKNLSNADTYLVDKSIKMADQTQQTYVGETSKYIRQLIFNKDENK